MDKLPICLIMLLAVLLNSCGRKSSTAVPGKGSDSIYRYDHIYHIAISEPQRALALADTAEMLNLLRPDHTCLNAVKAMIYQNGLGQRKLAKFYSQKAYEDTEFRKDTNSYLNNLAQLAGLCYKSSDYAAAIRHATEGLQMARTHGLQNLEAKFLMYIGMSQFYTGITKDAQANMNRSIALYEKIVDKEQSWSSVNDLLYTLGETMAALCAIGDYEQAATLIPNILKANSRHEQMVDQAPPGAIDMYKAFVYAQCMEVYHHLGHKEQAGECYQKCLSTDYVKSPDGVVLLTHYRIWTGDYRQALHDIRTAKRIYRQKRNTESEYYANELLADEMEVLTRLGQYKEAVDVSREIIALKDTLFERKQQDDAQELAVIYESGEKDRQIQKEQAEKHLLIVFVTAVIVALGVVVHYNRRMRRRNVSLVRSVQKGIACKDELLQKEEECLVYKAQIETMAKRLEELEHTPDDDSSASVVNAEATGVTESGITVDEKELLKHALHQIAVRQLYLQPGITAKTLQEELHVPASLFGTHFKEQTGHSFSEHINKLRMDYAAKLLTEYPQYTIDAIAKMCGIDSRQHFHRLFSEYFGITPSAFRKNHLSSDNKDIKQ